MCSKQLLDPEDVDLVPAADRERGITPEEFRLIKIHMSFRELLSFPPLFLTPCSSVSRCEYGPVWYSLPGKRFLDKLHK